jgi:hypothetical protein
MIQFFEMLVEMYPVKLPMHLLYYRGNDFFLHQQKTSIRFPFCIIILTR